MSEKKTPEFDYIKTAEKLADAFRELAKFDTIERAKSSPLMDDAFAVYALCPTHQDFFICVGIALTFNMVPDAPDHVTDDISDDYLSKHPGKT